jgi:hypothetical protein
MFSCVHKLRNSSLSNILNCPFTSPRALFSNTYNTVSSSTLTGRGHCSHI